MERPTHIRVMNIDSHRPPLPLGVFKYPQHLAWATRGEVESPNLQLLAGKGFSRITTYSNRICVVV